MALDHGVINVPLAKRGNIDAQLDKHKAEEAAKQKDKVEARNAYHVDDVSKAKAMVAAIDEETAKKFMATAKMTRKQLDKHLNSIAHWTPKKIFKLLEGNE